MTLFVTDTITHYVRYRTVPYVDAYTFPKVDMKCCLYTLFNTQEHNVPNVMHSKFFFLLKTNIEINNKKKTKEKYK